MNVLLVDDQQIERELIKEALFATDELVDITEVSNAEDGLTHLKTVKYDVVLLDYQMPSMNGLQFLGKMQLLEIEKELPVVIISNNTDEQLMLSFISAGAHDFLLKEEVTPSHLLRCIKQSQKRLQLERKLHESYQKVKLLAERDQLTGLANRHYFEESVKSLLANPRGIKGVLAVMVLDLDGFKMINDSLGHKAGDQVLIELANRFRNKFRESQLFARLGGDEFAFVFSGIQKANAAYRIAERILSSFESPFNISEHELLCSGSIGISLNMCAELDLEELIKRADIAMYKAKSLGKGKACLYEECMEHEFFRCYKIENELRDSLAHNQFELYFQPIFDTCTNVISCVETLIRWPNGKTTQSPQELIKVAEESRLIERLGRWIIEQAFVQFSQLRQQANCQSLNIAINLSPIQLHDLNLVGFICEHAEKNQLPLSCITLEVTETALLENSDSTIEAIDTIRNLGCKIALDDFGTGYSSISHLLNYPIDIVKFDKSLIERVLDDEKAKLMLVGLTAMLNNLNIETVAEGVELKEHVALCQEISVTRLQGYFFKKPMPVAQLMALLK